QAHAVEALEAEELVRGDDAEVAPELEQVRLELVVDLQLDARHVALAALAPLVARLGDPLEHHPVAVGLLDLHGLLEELARRLLDARVDALALDVEELRELPGGDAYGLQVGVVARDVRERQHEQPLAEDAHLLPAQRQRVRLGDGELAAPLAGRGLPSPTAATPAVTGYRAPALGARRLRPSAAAAVGAAPALDVERLDLDRGNLAHGYRLGARSVHTALPSLARSRQPNGSGDSASTFPPSSPLNGRRHPSTPTSPLRYPVPPAWYPSFPAGVPRLPRLGTAPSAPRYPSPPLWSQRCRPPREAAAA